jgi:hypothetical protein
MLIAPTRPLARIPPPVSDWGGGVRSTGKKPTEGNTMTATYTVDVFSRLREEPDVPLRSHDSLSMNRSLMAAVLVDGQIQELVYRPTVHV